jgi:phosphatidylethanolamine/phosphatidyl-N-methylethanolamine N-methyltransferase
VKSSDRLDHASPRQPLRQDPGKDVDPARAAVESAYARWAPIYDLVFDVLLAPGRKAIVAAADQAGARVLDVGVGTGLELPLFRRAASIIGIDLSEPMLQRARRRVKREALSRVHGLAVMDGARLAFADASFDAVIVPYVLTTVPQPERTLDEIARVARPGGEIILVHHVAAESGPRAALERAAAPLADRLGWRPEFPWSVLGDWLARRPDLRLVERRTLPPLNLFTLARIRRLKDAAPATVSETPAIP